MLRVVAVVTRAPLPGYSRSRTIVIEPPMGAQIMSEGVLLLDAGKRASGAPHLLVPWANLTCVELGVEEDDDASE